MMRLSPKPAQPRKVVNDADLRSFEQEDDYKRRKLIRNAVTGVLVAAVVAIPFILLGAFVVDAGIRTQVIRLIVANLPGLLYTGLVIVGIRASR